MLFKLLLFWIQYICPNGRMTENVFKRIPANFNPNLYPNSKAQKRFQKTK